MRYIKIVSFIIMLGLLVFNNKIFGAVNTWDMQGRPIVMYSDSEAIVITGKVRHRGHRPDRSEAHDKRHHPVSKNHRHKYK